MLLTHLWQLREVAAVLKSVAPSERNSHLRSRLQQIRMPPEYMLPISAGMRVTGICVEKCKWLSSVTVPLWIAFECADPIAPPVLVIFKVRLSYMWRARARVCVDFAHFCVLLC